MLTIEPDTESEEVKESLSLHRVPAYVRVAMRDEFLVHLLTTP